MKQLHLLNLKHVPILLQLQIEEALLRADQRDWCLINQGTSPSIVLGISGKVERLIDREKLAKKPIPLVRRFSGGGTVVVDSQTTFVTFIFNRNSIDVPPSSQKISLWSEEFYRPIFSHPEFAWRENDYVLGKKKFGGNAQYLAKERWLHHSSLLWGYDHEMMSYLLMPEKMPDYRQKRSHENFLCSLKEMFPRQEMLTERICENLRKKFYVKEISLGEVEEILRKPHRKSVIVH